MKASLVDTCSLGLSVLSKAPIWRRCIYCAVPRDACTDKERCQQSRLSLTGTLITLLAYTVPLTKRLLSALHFERHLPASCPASLEFTVAPSWALRLLHKQERAVAGQKTP